MMKLSIAAFTGAGMIVAKFSRILGVLDISGNRSILMFFARGSGRRRVRGYALRMRFRICTQTGGMTSHSATW